MGELQTLSQYKNNETNKSIREKMEITMIGCVFHRFNIACEEYLLRNDYLPQKTT